MVLSAYARGELRHDGDLAPYRGRHPDREDEPSILLLTSRSKRGSPGTVQRLEHEQALAPELDPAWAVRPRMAYDASLAIDVGMTPGQHDADISTRGALH